MTSPQGPSIAQHEVRFTDPPTKVIIASPPVLHHTPFGSKFDSEDESFNEKGSVADSLESTDIDRIQNQSKERHAKLASRLKETVPIPNTFFLPEPPKESSITGYLQTSGSPTTSAIHPDAEGGYGRRDTVTPLQYGSWPSAYMPSPTVQRHLEFAIPGLENGFEAFTSPPEIDLLRSRRFTENEIQELLKEGLLIDTAVEKEPIIYDAGMITKQHDEFCPLCSRSETDDGTKAAKKELWVLTLPVRVELYVSLFQPARFEKGLKGWLTEIVRGNVRLVRDLQRFVLHAIVMPCKVTARGSSIKGEKANSDPAPPKILTISTVVDDVFTMIKILSQSVNHVPMGYSRNPMEQFKQKRLDSWRERWGDRIRESGDVWDEYPCAVCDAIFGLWPAKGHKGKTLFHYNKLDWRYRCVAQMFSGINEDGVFEGSISDRHLFDAAFIEANGPFRFEATHRLDQHLSVTRDHKILFFSDWKRWTSLCYHRILRNKNPETLFSNMINVSLGRRQPSNRYATASSHISGDIATTIRLCFHLKNQTRGRDSRPFWSAWLPTSALNYLPETDVLSDAVEAHFPTFLVERWRSIPSIRLPFIFPSREALVARSGILSVGPWIPQIRASSRDAIAERIGIEMPVGKAFEEVAAQLEEEDDLGTIWQLYPFLGRAARLTTTLKSWKPKTVWELRYAGYGGVNPVELYGFYFGLGFGIIAIVALAVAIAQTFASFRALS